MHFYWLIWKISIELLRNSLSPKKITSFTSAHESRDVNRVQIEFILFGNENEKEYAIVKEEGEPF